MRVVVLGAGFGGLELTTRLSEELGDDVDVVLIDRTDGFVFGFSKLDVMFGRTDRRRGAPPVRRHREARRAVRAGRRSTSIDPAAKRVETDAGAVRRRRPRRRARRRPRPGGDARAGRGRPRVLHGGRARSRCATCSADFDGGRVIVGVTSTPFKCPPAPSETALLVHDHLVAARPARPVRDRAGDAPAGADPAVARRVAGAARRVRRARHRLASRAPRCAALDPDRKVAVARRRQRDAVRPVPRRADAPRARRSSRRPGSASTAGSRSTRSRSRPRSPACTRSATSPASARRRPACSPRARRRSSPTRSSPGTAAPARPRPTTVAASATSSSATARSRASTSRSWPGRAGRHARRPVGDLAADKAEFGASRIPRWFGRDGRTSHRQLPPLAMAVFVSANCRAGCPC